MMMWHPDRDIYSIHIRVSIYGVTERKDFFFAHLSCKCRPSLSGCVELLLGSPPGFNNEVMHR